MAARPSKPIRPIVQLDRLESSQSVLLYVPKTHDYQTYHLIEKPVAALGQQPYVTFGREDCVGHKNRRERCSVSYYAYPNVLLSRHLEPKGPCERKRPSDDDGPGPKRAKGRTNPPPPLFFAAAVCLFSLS